MLCTELRHFAVWRRDGDLRPSAPYLLVGTVLDHGVRSGVEHQHRQLRMIRPQASQKRQYQGPANNGAIIGSRSTTFSHPSLHVSGNSSGSPIGVVEESCSKRCEGDGPTASVNGATNNACPANDQHGEGKRATIGGNARIDRPLIIIAGNPG